MNKAIKFIKEKGSLLVIALLLATLVSVVGIQPTVQEAPSNSILTIGSEGETVITLGHESYAAGDVDYTFGATNADAQFQAALDALPATGGRLVCVSSVQVNWTALTTVTRAIPNVIIEGSGRGTSFVGDGVTPIFTAGGNGWEFNDIAVDAGSIAMGATTGWMWTSVLDNATYYAYRSPYGQSAVGSITVDSLTNARVTFAGASGLLSDDADLTFATGTNTLATDNVTATGSLRIDMHNIIEVATDDTDGLVEYTSIQSAVNAAVAAGATAINPYTILLHPGSYQEEVTLTTGVNLRGMDKEECILDLTPVAAGASVTLVTMAEGCHISNITLEVTADATGSGIGIEVGDNNCVIEDLDIHLIRTANNAFGISQNAGDTAKTIEINNVNIDADTNVGELAVYINRDNKTVYIRECWIQGGDYGVIVGGNTDIYMYQNHVEVNVRPLGIGAAIQTNDANAVVRMHGDTVEGLIVRTTGAITYKNNSGQYEVWQGAYNSVDATTLRTGMLIKDAINAAAAETPAPGTTVQTATEILGYITYTVLIHPGIYDEELVCQPWINLQGVGTKGSVVIYRDNPGVSDAVVQIANNCEISDLTVRLGTPGADNRFVIMDNGVACTAKMTNLVLEIVAPATFISNIFSFAGAGTYTIERCSYSIGGTGATLGITNNTAAATIHLIDNDFTFTNINATHIYSDIAGTWTGEGNRWSGTCHMFNVTDGTITLDNDAMLCTGAWTNTGTTMTLRNCVIEAPVVAGNLSNVRMKDCSYRTIQRSGTGNIVDESSRFSDAPWHAEKWTWQALLANAQVVEREGIGGTAIDAGTGQVLLTVIDNAADIAGIEISPEVAGSLGNEFTPAQTPRFLTQISAHTDNASAVGNPAFDPHIEMFFGIRETLGNAVPGAAEDHAGFIWDGTNFNASSDDGVATEETNLATPSDDVQHQLEVIIFGGVTTVGWVEFYVDSALVATHSTRIPVNGLDWQHLVVSGAGGGGDTITVTIRNGGVQECPS